MNLQSAIDNNQSTMINRKGNIKIMIVEDENVIALDLQTTLEGLGYSVPVIVDTGEDAIKKAEQEKPDLILMDIMLRGKMDGIEAAGEICSRFPIPVVYLTSFTDGELMERARKTGYFGYILKPYEEKDLNTTIQVALDKYKMEQELRLAKEEAEKSREEAEEANKLKDKFISLVAHDLKSPFTTILGFMSLIMDDTDPTLNTKHREMMERVTSQGKRLVAMIQELLDISRFKTGKIQPKMEFVDGHFSASFIVENLKYEAKKKGVTLLCEVPERTRLYADPSLFNEVIKNLVSNAIKFCKEGDRISLYVPPEEDSTIAVKDTGAGIKKERQAHLFKYEEQTSTLGTAGERGTGLGLPLSRDIIEAHGGTLELESAPGKGSVFYARLPLIRPKVLIVDDDMSIRLILKKFIKRTDSEILEAESGKEALDLLAKTKIHLIITDLNMPVMGGFELLDNIRNKLGMEDIPVIVLTSDAEEKTREEAFRLGANDFVNKPIKNVDFIPRVRRYIGC